MKNRRVKAKKQQNIMANSGKEQTAINLVNNPQITKNLQNKK